MVALNNDQPRSRGEELMWELAETVLASLVLLAITWIVLGG
jgi:hypothetical protein